jgi:hypothetical protein
MAASTRSKTGGRASITESLLGSEDEPNGLHGPVPADTYSSLIRMAQYLGLQTSKAVSTWLQSPAFLPYFEELYEDCIRPGQTLAAASNRPRKQSPQLAAVQSAIADGEKFGDQKYSGYHVDKANFEEVDYYALCLYRLCKANTDGRDGVFRGKTMGNVEKEARLWCAMLRATYDRASSRQNRQRKQPEDPQGGPASPGDGASSDAESLTPTKKQRLSFQEKKNIHHRTDSENLRGQITSLQLEKPSAESNMSPTADRSLCLENQGSNDNLGQDDDSGLEGGHNGNGVADETSTETHAMEKFFNNPMFQRFDYKAACHALGITDPKRPRFVGMPTTMVFRSWQVTGINTLMNFEKDPAIRAAILADSTGLGKTFEIMGYWYRVSCLVKPSTIAPLLKYNIVLDDLRKPATLCYCS